MPTRRKFFMGAGAAAAGAVCAPLATAAANHPGSDATLLALPALPQPTLPIVGSRARFPVRRIYCIGRNYLSHVKELNHDTREQPFFFQKARDMLVQSGEPVVYPTMTHDYEHEIELVLAMKSGGMNIAPDDALNHVFGYAVGLDMTRRDLQNLAQEKRQPWEAGKSFDQSAPCSAITPLEQTGQLRSGRIHLSINDTTVTDGDIQDMIWSPAEIIAHISAQFSLAAGDLIYTGTPAGVGKVVPGDVMVARIDGLSPLRTPVLAPRA